MSQDEDDTRDESDPASEGGVVAEMEDSAREAAREQYGVAITADGGIDYGETEQLRSNRKSAN